MENKNYNILVVSDFEDRITLFTAYANELEPKSSLLSADNFNNAILVLQNFLPTIIFCDETVSGKSSFEFLDNIKELQNQRLVYIICVTPDNSFDNLERIINHGFDDYLFDINNKALILNRLRLGRRNLELHNKLKLENLKLNKLKSKLEDELEGMKSLSIKLIESKLPSARGMLTKIANISIWIAGNIKELSEDDIFNIEIASYFSQVGRIFLSQDNSLLPVMRDGRLINEELSKVPSYGREILSSMKRFEKASEIVYHIWENFDGTGIPKKLQKWQIPIESRIIRVATDYEEKRYFLNLSMEKALESLNSNSNRLYDPRVVSLLENYKSATGSKSVEKYLNLRVEELEEGMIIAKDIISSSGHKMLKEGTSLTTGIISTLNKHANSDPILGYIFVRKSFVQNKLGV